MSEQVPCKKCRGTGEHRGGERCKVCQGAKYVVVTVDDDGNKVITPAPKAVK